MEQITRSTEEIRLRSVLKDLTDAIELYQSCEPHMILFIWQKIKDISKKIQKEFDL